MPDRDERTFTERVERVNLAFLVQVPTRALDRLAQLVEDNLNEVGGRLVYTKVSSNRLFIDEALPKHDRDYREDDRNDREDKRRGFAFGIK